jgi:hypothetical protein
VSIFFPVNEFIELFLSDSNAVATSMRVALHCVWTTIISQLFGVNESAAPCDMQKLFRGITALIFAAFDVRSDCP